jgi:diadenosine tetraphosphate (Ap4A) HIT family hydrolase
MPRLIPIFIVSLRIPCGPMDSSRSAQVERSPRSAVEGVRTRLTRLGQGTDPAWVARLASGPVVLADRQPAGLEGWCTLLADPAVRSVNELAPQARAGFMSDLVLIGDALLAVCGAERINYLVLCNQLPLLHGHVVPRSAREDPARRLLDPFAGYDVPGSRPVEPVGRDADLLTALRSWFQRHAPTSDR